MIFLLSSLGDPEPVAASAALPPATARAAAPNAVSLLFVIIPMSCSSLGGVS
jgi:hypothetical protein